MRQRVLLGAFNRQRYIETYGLLDECYNPEQIYAQATDVGRVIASQYSEFMGLYPPKNPAEIEPIEVQEKHLPPMKVRSRTLTAVLDGYTLVPVYSYIPEASGDALGPGSCYYVSECIDNRYADPTQYVAETEYYLPAIGYRVAKAFNWTEA